MSLEQLIERYPRLFRGEPPHVYSHVPAGWMGPLTELLDSIDGRLDDVMAQRFRVGQIKEKFGSLRFYWSLDRQGGVVLDALGPGGAMPRPHRPEDPMRLFQEINDWVQEAEEKSARLCQDCGAPSRVRSHGGWMTTCCPSCLEKRDRQ